MRVLLDERLPYDLIPLLHAHDVQPVARLGWAGSKNGMLLRRAADVAFDALRTIDKRLSEQQLIPANIAVVTIRARSNRMPDLAPLVPEILQTLASAMPGQLTRVGA